MVASGVKVTAMFVGVPHETPGGHDGVGSTVRGGGVPQLTGSQVGVAIRVRVGPGVLQPPFRQLVGDGWGVGVPQLRTGSQVGVGSLVTVASGVSVGLGQPAGLHVGVASLVTDGTAVWVGVMQPPFRQPVGEG
jgi:hypothetical protein